MITLDMVNKIYDEFKKDLNVDVEMPDIIVTPKKNVNYISRIVPITSDLMEVCISWKYVYGKVNTKFVCGILYHEFTHIYDRKKLLLNIKEDDKRTRIMFPYTEFHAARIELTKRLELFYNQSKNITLSTKLYGVNSLISLKEFFEMEHKELFFRLDTMKNKPDINYISDILFQLIYLIGFNATVKDYNIIEINICEKMEYISEDIENLVNILMCKDFTDELCHKSYEVTKNIFSKIAMNYIN